MADPDWWQRAVLYQIYPRSFRDADGDGVGDIEGIGQRLDHLVELGVDAMWLSPIFPSPMADFGYDVADYCDIDPLFGSLADFDALLADAHARGLKVILDLVANHTSDQHPWFQESRASRDVAQARLVHLARPGARRRAAQQLAVASSAAGRGNTTPRPASITFTPFSPSSPTSTGAIPGCATPCTRSCASG